MKFWDFVRYTARLIKRFGTDIKHMFLARLDDWGTGITGLERQDAWAYIRGL